MALIAFAVPILPGKSETVEHFEADLDAAGLRDHYEELNRLAGIRRHMEWIQPTPQGDVRIIVFESDTPPAIARGFSTGDPYDDWWRARVTETHGFDPATASYVPRLIFDWKSTD